MLIYSSRFATCLKAKKKEASNRYFDVRDIEYVNVRQGKGAQQYIRNPNQSHSAFREPRKIHARGSLHVSRSSAISVHPKRVEVEMKFLEQEISLASAEEYAMKRVLEEDKKSIRDRKSSKSIRHARITWKSRSRTKPKALKGEISEI